MFDIKEITSITTAGEFECAALELFRFQAAHCAPYSEYLRLIGCSPEKVEKVEKIPCLPIGLFRNRKVYCGSGEAEKVFTSSSTGSDTPSKHYVAHLGDYEECFTKAYDLFYKGRPIYALLPCYLEREGSSLVYMADALIRRYGGGFYLNDHARLLEDLAADNREKILLGVSYALWDLAEEIDAADATATERAHVAFDRTIIMETGGMKGRREEISKSRFHEILCKAFGTENIHSEYGMAELMSQAYSCGQGIFVSPPWMKVFIRDVNDPFTLLEDGRSGGVNIIDLGNLYSCAFIETQDMGRRLPDGRFELLGRIDHSQTRGCNLLIQ